MSNTVQFREKLIQLLGMCKEKKNEVEKEVVEQFFEEESLSDEQMNLVYDYLLSQKVLVKGYEKTVKEDLAEENENKFTEEEREFLKQYQEELRMIPMDDPMSSLLPQVLEIAKTLYHPDIFLGDLIQEGSFGLVIGMKQNLEEADLLRMARESMQTMVETQNEIKIQDQKMADKVNELDEKIKKLIEEMGRKVSVDELAQLLDISEEEIEDIIHLAGEDLEETED